MKYLLSFIILFGTHVSVQASGESEDTFCLAQNIYFEAGNQPVAGKMAVAEVVYNRVAMAAYPDTICGVVYQAEMEENWKGHLLPVLHRCQFSWYCDGKGDLPTDSKTWMEAFRLAGMVLAFKYEDITEGSLWYHSDSVEPYWSKQLSLVTTIDNHLFYK